MEVKCNICSKYFSKRYNLLRHISSKHENLMFNCNSCNEKFKWKSSLIRHVRRKHDNNTKSAVSIKCVACPFMCEKKYMLDHYRSSHDISITTYNESFSNFTEFEEWKATMEKETISKYIKCRTKTSNDKVVHFYRCHRDGFYKSSGKNIRRLKQGGSNKVNGYCPARLNVTVTKIGNVKVQFIKTHVGHEMDLERLALSKSEKDIIASKLSQNISFDEVLNCVKDGITSNSDLGRIHLLTKKDLFNIQSSYNLREMKCSKNLKLPHEIEDVKVTLRKQFTEILSKVIDMEGAETVQKALLPIKSILSTSENNNLQYLAEIAEKRKKCTIKSQKTFTSTMKSKSIATLPLSTADEKDKIAIKLLK